MNAGDEQEAKWRRLNQANICEPRFYTKWKLPCVLGANANAVITNTMSWSLISLYPIKCVEESSGNCWKLCPTLKKRKTHLLTSNTRDNKSGPLPDSVLCSYMDRIQTHVLVDDFHHPTWDPYRAHFPVSFKVHMFVWQEIKFHYTLLLSHCTTILFIGHSCED